MKTTTYGSALVAVLMLMIPTGGLFASPDDHRGDRYAYVFVTGSMIPQKVTIHPIGTKTASALRVYDRREIDQTGRFTTEDVLRLDPSLQVHSGRAGSGD